MSAARKLVEYDAEYRGEYAEHAPMRRFVYEDTRGVQTVELRSIESFQWQRPIEEHRYDVMWGLAAGAYDPATL